MARQVKLGLAGLRLNETECRLLEMIVERSRAQHRVGCEYVALSRSEMAAHLRCSVLTTLRSCQSLEDAGLIDARAGCLDTGARVANSYCATALGIEVARLYRLERARCESIEARCTSVDSEG